MGRGFSFKLDLPQNADFPKFTVHIKVVLKHIAADFSTPKRALYLHSLKQIS